MFSHLYNYDGSGMQKSPNDFQRLTVKTLFRIGTNEDAFIGLVTLFKDIFSRMVFEN